VTGSEVLEFGSHLPCSSSYLSPFHNSLRTTCIVPLIILVVTKFTQPLFYALSSFNATCQFTRLLNLGSLIIVLTPSGLLRSIMLNHTYSIIYNENIIFDLRLFYLRFDLRPPFRKRNEGVKQGL
jgi:hypothetical protein